MKRFGVILTLMIILFVAVPVGVGYADDGFDRVIGEGEVIKEDIVLFGGTLLIEDGALVDGSVSVFGGEATIDGDVDGDVAVFGGQLNISGSVDGDMVVFGGTIHADSLAAVDGDCVLVGGNISGDGRESIGCTAVGDLPSIALPAIAAARSGGRLPIPEVPEVRVDSRGPGFFGTAASTVGRSLFLGLLALVFAVVLPNHLNQISESMKRKPAAAGAVGFLTLIAGVSLIVIVSLISALLILVCIGLLGIPLVIVMSLALLAATIMGWAAAGYILGQRMARWLKLTNWSTPLVAAMGTVVLTMAAGIMSSAPFWLGGWIWWLLAFAIGCAGLGAAALTRFGTQPYPVSAASYGDKVDVVLETLPSDDDDLDPVEKPTAE